MKNIRQPKHGFYQSAQIHADAAVPFVHVNCRHQCGGNPVVIELTILEDLHFQVNITGKSVATYNHLSRLVSLRDLDNLMPLISASDLCRGFVASSERVSGDTNGQTQQVFASAGPVTRTIHTKIVTNHYVVRNLFIHQKIIDMQQLQYN